MTHELRTPIAGTIGMLDLALEMALNPDQRDYLELVKMMGGRLWAESLVEKGSTFHFTVKVGTDEGEPAILNKNKGFFC